MLTHTMRILDATFNRAMEGLRVCEDFVRFALDDYHLTEALKVLRHDLLATLAALPSAHRFAARDVTHDLGTKISTAGETERQDLFAVFLANMHRARQSLRSLEEFGKVIDAQFAARIESLRYRLYTLEKAVSMSYESGQRLQGISLCVLIDGRTSQEEFAAFVAQLLDAEIGMIQLRDKRLPDRDLIGRARALVSLTHKSQRSRPVTIINDRPDIAVAANADGVHLGQDDLGVHDARVILGPHRLIGVSTHSIEQARTAALEGANYLGAGPTFRSSTKAFDEFPGLGFLAQIADEISLPTFAIGGIDATNLAQVLPTGVTRVAVSGAVAKAENPTAAAQAILAILPSATDCSEVTP